MAFTVMAMQPSGVPKIAGLRLDAEDSLALIMQNSLADELVNPLTGFE